MDDLIFESIDDVEYLSEIYALERYHYSIVKDSVKLNYLYESTGNLEILTEGLSDVFSKMGDFFKKLFNSVKEFFKKIIMYISSYFMEIDKFCNKYKNELQKIDDVNFTISGYNYTLETEPNLDEFNKIIEGYNDGLENVKKMKDTDIKKEHVEYLSDNNIAKLRGSILGTGKPEPSDDFVERVRKFYRDDEENETNIEIDLSTFRQVVNSSSELMKGKKKAEKLRDDTTQNLSKAEVFFSKKAPTIYKEAERIRDASKLEMNDGKLSTSSDSQSVSVSYGNMLDKFIKLQYNKTHTVANIANIVVREYANAFKDKVKMHQLIIRKGLYGKNDKNEEDDK